jgi:hypothetical protein
MTGRGDPRASPAGFAKGGFRVRRAAALWSERHPQRAAIVCTSTRNGSLTRRSTIKSVLGG